MKTLTAEQEAAGKAADAEKEQIEEVTKSLGQYTRGTKEAAEETGEASSKIKNISGAFATVGKVVAGASAAVDMVGLPCCGGHRAWRDWGSAGRMFILGTRRKFTEEYRREAAKLVIDTDRPIAHVAEELGIGAQLLGKWVRAEKQRRDVGTGLSEDERKELVRLRREVRELRLDNEFLGKAAFFAARPARTNGSK